LAGFIRFIVYRVGLIARGDRHREFALESADPFWKNELVAIVLTLYPDFVEVVLVERLDSPVAAVVSIAKTHESVLSLIRELQRGNELACESEPAGSAMT